VSPERAEKSSFFTDRSTRRGVDVSSSAVQAQDPSEGVAVLRLIDAARADGREPLGRLLQLYRNYLSILATTQLNPRMRARVSPSDLVQETMLAAHRDFDHFRGDSEREFLAWLRQILIHSLHHAVATHVAAKKRDVRCEVSMDQVNAAVERSAVRMANCLADPGPSPSAAIHQRERSVALADQLARLKPQYREIIVLRNLKGLPFEQIAQRTNRTPGSTRMLWLRAIEKFKEICEPIE
jgi:RNA polymerase sigma-70 factor (ECF subfamily)